MRRTILSLFTLAISAVLAGCTLRTGGTELAPGAPAPTSAPIQQTAGPNTPLGLVPPERPIALPAGFAISVFVRGLDDPRMMAVGPDGTLYVAERGADRVVRLPNKDGAVAADDIQTAADGLTAPSSLAFHPDGSLYVGETTRVLRLSEPDAAGVYQNRQVVIEDLPAGGHNTRTVLFSPDGSTLFVSVGSSCNVCQESDERRAAIVRYNPDGGGETIYARGLRNAVGITFRPGTDELWATNNGRDMMGDDQPPETIYRVESGQDYGWPRCQAARIPDPQFGGEEACQGVESPEVEMQAHSAPLGLAFYNGTQFPEEYHGDLFVAFHGSWNRSVPTGYKVVRIPMDGGEAGMVQDFATGWLVGDSAWGRPVDIVVGPAGDLFVSDDKGGAIYRIFYLGD